MDMDSKLASFLFQATGVDRARRFLDLASLRHKLISSNVANVTTPGYQARDIDFKKELARLAQSSSNLAGVTTHRNHVPLGQHPGRVPKVERTRVSGRDLNSIDIDREIPKMAQNELQYTIAARLLKNKFDGLRKAITSK